MRVQDLMTPNPVTVDASTPLPVIYQALRRHAIRHLPLTHEGRLVGVISERDLREARILLEEPVSMWELAYHASNRLAHELMRSPPTTVSVDDSIEHAAALLISDKIEALPVLRGEKLVGILTATDILRWVAHSRCPAVSD